jgi:hypothetical protein
MSVIRKYDVQPSTENKGLTIRAPFADGANKQALEQFLAEAERTKKSHLARMANYADRDIHVVTPNAGLTLVGPTSPDGGSPAALAHNAAMAALDEKLVALDAKIAALDAALAVLESAKK